MISEGPDLLDTGTDKNPEIDEIRGDLKAALKVFFGDLEFLEYIITHSRCSTAFILKYFDRIDSILDFTYDTSGSERNKTVDYKNFEEVLRLMVREEPDNVFAFADRFIDEPYAREVFSEAIKAGGARGAFKYTSHYISKPWARDFLTEALESLAISEEDIMFSSENSTQMSMGPLPPDDVQARYCRIQHDRSAILQFFASLPHISHQPWVKDLTLEIIRKRQFAANTFLRTHCIPRPQDKELPFKDELLQAALAQQAAHDPLNVLASIKAWSHLPNAKEISFTAAARDPEKVFIALDYTRELPFVPFAQELFLFVAAKAPVAAMNYYPNYSSRGSQIPYTYDVLLCAVQAAPRDFFECLDQKPDNWALINQPYARELVLAAARKDPGAAIEFMTKYADRPWGYEVVKLAKSLIANAPQEV